MNKQEIFNTVYEALLKQGRPSLKLGVCSYRGLDGTKCAIGHLIPDEFYNVTLEGKGVYDIPAEVLESSLQVSNINPYMYFLSDLQNAHDQHLSFYGIKEWKEQMKGIAYEFNLVFPG